MIQNGDAPELGRLPRGELWFVAAWLSLFVTPILTWFVGPAGFLLLAVVAVLAYQAHRRAEDPRLRRTIRISEVLVLVGLLFLGWVFLGSSIRMTLHPPRQARYRAECQEHLKAIWAACRQYERRNGVLPDRLGELRLEDVRDLGEFVCPASTDAPGTPADLGAWASYEYDPAGTDWVLRDKQPDWHAPGGRNVLGLDGKVEFVREQLSAPGRGPTAPAAGGGTAP